MLKDATAVPSKVDRECGVDCPNAILVSLLHIQELWMDIMPQTLIYSISLLTVTTKRLTWEFLNIMWLYVTNGLHLKVSLCRANTELGAVAKVNTTNACD